MSNTRRTTRNFIAATTAFTVLAFTHTSMAAQPERGLPSISRDAMLGINAATFSASQMSKWQELASRHQARRGAAWTATIARLRAAPQGGLLQAVNAEINKARYVSDQQNWGKADYWAAPADLLARGGDCEDFAAAKYFALKELGIPASRMRMLITRDHAVLVVDTADGPVVLDNLRTQTYRLNSSLVSRAVFALNDRTWWVSVGGRQGATQVADRSARALGAATQPRSARPTQSALPEGSPF
jgi:predicted transglutaminase-like cysteine proteinase